MSLIELIEVTPRIFFTQQRAALLVFNEQLDGPEVPVRQRTLHRGLPHHGAGQDGAQGGEEEGVDHIAVGVSM